MRTSTGAFVRSILLVAALLAMSACGPAGVTVDGRVVTTLGTPVEGVSVSVGGRGPVTTDADGAFSVANVPTPYDLVVFSAGGGWAHVFEAVDTPAPSVVPFRTPSGGFGLPGMVTSVDVTLSVSLMVGQTLVLCPEHPSLPVALCTSVQGSGTGPYEALVGWEGPAAIDVAIRAVIYDVAASGASTAVPYMGTATVSVQDGVPAAVTVSMSIPPPPTFNVDVDLPFGSVLGTVRTFLTLPGGTNTVALPQVTPPVNLPFQQSIPAIGGSAVGVVVEAPGMGGSVSLAWVPGLAVPPQDASLTLNAAPDVLEPYDGATGVAPGVTFAVADGVDDAHTFVFHPVTNGPEIAVSTMDGTIHLPDLGTYSALLAWPSGADYTWTVRTARPYLDASNLVTGEGDPEARLLRTFQGAVGYGPGPAYSGSATVTPSRTFTVE